MENRKNIDISTLRSDLEASQGQEYWRSLDNLAQTDEFATMVQREFPEQASELNDPVSRRNFLKLMSASLALGGVTG
jgi:MoCo/4Fe-4S cofactor protein with predicted Tat translocation signal